jgi:hypothetical protein
MKHLQKIEFDKRIQYAKDKTNYVYEYTGLEKQTDKIKVTCLVHNHSQEQRREYAFQGRKLKCCNEFSPMLESECEEIIKKYNTQKNITVTLEETFHGSNTKVKVFCAKHNHTRIIKLESLRRKKTEVACNQCTHEQLNRGHTFNAEKWAERAKLVHADRYDYSKMENTGLYRTIVCKVHGEFQQNIHNHVYLGNGCPKCVIIPSISKAEDELKEFFDTLGFLENRDYFRTDRSIISPHELDFYFKDKKIGIEYNGDYWHSSEKKYRKYHQDKKMKGIEAGINILMIYEHLWNTKKDIIKNRLKSLLSVETNKCFARETTIENIPNNIAKDFCDKYHIQGWTVSSINYGLINKNKELVALMTFGPSRFTDHDYELLRYVTRGVVVGGASKLFSHFKNQNTFNTILSYADLDWSVGNVYDILGFKSHGITAPGYVWVKGNIVLSRYKTQMENEDKTMKDQGFIKIYKCGSLKYVYEKNI